MTNVGTGEAVDVNDERDIISGSRGFGVTDAKIVWPFCLESGEYSITAFDGLGEGW